MRFAFGNDYPSLCMSTIPSMVFMWRLAVKSRSRLDEGTVRRIERTADRLGIPKSAVVREAVAEYAVRAGRLTDEERDRLLTAFDDDWRAALVRQCTLTRRMLNGDELDVVDVVCLERLIAELQAQHSVRRRMLRPHRHFEQFTVDSRCHSRRL